MSELWVAIMEWVASRNPGRIDVLDDLWRGATPEWSVEVNGRREETGGLPPLTIRLAHRTFLSLGIITPTGGIITGASEDDLIRHFKAESSAIEATP